MKPLKISKPLGSLTNNSKQNDLYQSDEDMMFHTLRSRDDKLNSAGINSF